MPHFRVQCGVKIEHHCCYACYGYLQGTPNVRYFSRPITLLVTVDECSDPKGLAMYTNNDVLFLYMYIDSKLPGMEEYK